MCYPQTAVMEVFSVSIIVSQYDFLSLSCLSFPARHCHYTASLTTQLADDVRAHQALRCHADTSVGRRSLASSENVGLDVH